MKPNRCVVTVVTIGLLAVLCFVSGTGPARAGARPVASPAVTRGNETFQQSCAVCHGRRGKGDGLAASSRCLESGRVLAGLDDHEHH